MRVRWSHLSMKTVSRWYNRAEDFSRVMSFLRDTFAETGSLHNWLPPRFEGSSDGMASGTRIWEDINGQNPKIVAMANPEEKFTYFIQFHPAYAFLEGEIVDWICLFFHSSVSSPKMNSSSMDVFRTLETS